MKRIVLLILIVAAIPFTGWAVGKYADNTFQDQWNHAVITKFGSVGTEAIAAGKVSFHQFCDSSSGKINPICETDSNVLLLQKASLSALSVGLGLLLIIFLLGRVASFNRSLLLYSFSPAIKLILVVLFALILLQGAIAAYAIYLFESMVLGTVHIVIIGGILLAAVLGSLFMIKEGMSVSKRVSKNVLGKVVSQSMQPELWNLVNNLATRLGAIPPSNIIIGLDTNFFVTSSDVTPYPSADRQVGETLYLSLPLMRILSLDELTAVIGHELGHFCGDDTRFSLKFYPIYAGTSQALDALHVSSRSNGYGLALLPASAILSFFMEQFGFAERAIGRDREFMADKLGASVSTPHSLSTALLKIGAFVPVWHSIWHAITIGKANPDYQEQIYTNISRLYAEIASSSVRPEHFDKVLSSAVTHPTDTHPQTGARIQALGISLKEIENNSLEIELESSSAKIITDLEKIEQELTQTEHQWRGTAPKK
ncbi:M48 family metallopeptidase [Undibacterium sp. CY7W]|uniref:M48 family metallopeptidase n=1 Tax=Undibacterium rugosum TaxID=2762291 RepID=A0A923IC92_9BURK|nr:M48 family metallopeptidase [Undibacterium rugosum]MBC3936735.1 M48 family metallopeptidase [Undibacterium rugosum]